MSRKKANEPVVEDTVLDSVEAEAEHLDALEELETIFETVQTVSNPEPVTEQPGLVSEWKDMYPNHYYPTVSELRVKLGVDLPEGVDPELYAVDIFSAFKMWEREETQSVPMGIVTLDLWNRLFGNV